MDQRFPKSMRLLTGRQFDAVREARLVKHAGPLRVAARANDLPHSRLGLAISRRVGGAVVRNRIKRMCREAFRLHRHEWPSGLDIVVMARPHEPAELDDYVRWLGEASNKLAREAARRSQPRWKPADETAS
jgi:ribonuclease P protein component